MRAEKATLSATLEALEQSIANSKAEVADATALNEEKEVTNTRV